MLPCICPVIDHRGRQNVVRTSVTHSAIASCATFLFLPHFDVICALLLDRCTETWNLFDLLNIPRLLLFSHFVLLGLYRGKVKCQRDGQDVRLAKRRRAFILSYPTRTQKLYMHSELSKWLLPQNKCSISNHEFRCMLTTKACSAVLS